jgi:phosphoribosyl 1,2-cyclic phosphodiesterase
MNIHFWGVRGSIPSPQTSENYKNKLKRILAGLGTAKFNTEEEIDKYINSLPFYLKNNYGGNTTCIEINDDAGNIFILDSGTGIRLFGINYLMRPNKPSKIHIFFTHFHWDHIQGFPFFIPAYLPNIEINFYSTIENFQKILVQQQNFHNFPRKLSEMSCKKEFIQMIPNKTIQIGNINIDCNIMNHPGTGTAYKFTDKNKKLIFTGDVEFTEEDIEKNNKFGNFFENADVAIFDSQYTLEESFLKFDWGHTSYNMAINLAANWNIKKLILTHFDPTYSDEKIMELEELSKEHVKLLKSINPEVIVAYEGLKIQI